MKELTRNEIEVLGFDIKEMVKKEVSNNYLYAMDTGVHVRSYREALDMGFGVDYIIDACEDILASEAKEKRLQESSFAPLNKWVNEAWQDSGDEKFARHNGAIRKKKHQRKRLLAFFGLQEKDLQVKYGELNLRVYKDLLVLGGGKDSHGRNAIIAFDRFGERTTLTKTIIFGYGSIDNCLLNQKAIVDDFRKKNKGALSI